MTGASDPALALGWTYEVRACPERLAVPLSPEDQFRRCRTCPDNWRHAERRLVIRGVPQSTSSTSRPSETSSSTGRCRGRSRNWSRGLGWRFVSRPVGACKVGTRTAAPRLVNHRTGEPLTGAAVRTRSASDTHRVTAESRARSLPSQSTRAALGDVPPHGARAGAWATAGSGTRRRGVQ
jgi:hypothetical protein